MNNSAPMLLAGLLVIGWTAAIPSYAQVFDSVSEPIATCVPVKAVIGKSKNVTPRHLARLHHDRALQLADAGRTGEAIEEDRQAIATEPNNPGHQILLGSLLADKGQFGNALAVYEHVIGRFPEQEEYLSELIGDLRRGLQLITIERAIDRLQTRSRPVNPPGTSPTQPEMTAAPVFVEVLPAVSSQPINPDPYSVKQPPPAPSKFQRARRAFTQLLLDLD
jgi:tetratricopeptide (TPR) repeat protein